MTAPPSTPGPATSGVTTTAPPTTPGAPPVVTIPAPVVPSVSDQTATPYIAVLNANGPQTKRIQARLLELGFWLGAVDGRYSLTTIQAVLAFQKYTGLPRTGTVDTATAYALTTVTYRATATVAKGSLVEVDKDRQLLFLVEAGRTSWTFNTSTGSGIAYSVPNKKKPWVTESGTAITPSGLFKVDREIDHGWWDGDLGKIYRPKYFHKGIAIHGMNVVPSHAVSHGCVRLSVPAMDFIWANNLMPIHTTVWVHGTP